MFYLIINNLWLLAGGARDRAGLLHVGCNWQKSFWQVEHMKPTYYKTHLACNMVNTYVSCWRGWFCEIKLTNRWFHWILVSSFKYYSTLSTSVWHVLQSFPLSLHGVVLILLQSKAVQLQCLFQFWTLHRFIALICFHNQCFITSSAYRICLHCLLAFIENKKY